MSITIEQARALKHGDMLLCNGAKWKVTGKVKTWKRNPEKVKVPVKHGLYNYGYITESVLNVVTLA